MPPERLPRAHAAAVLSTPVSRRLYAALSASRSPSISASACTITAAAVRRQRSTRSARSPSSDRTRSTTTSERPGTNPLLGESLTPSVCAQRPASLRHTRRADSANCPPPAIYGRQGDRNGHPGSVVAVYPGVQSIPLNASADPSIRGAHRGTAWMGSVEVRTALYRRRPRADIATTAPICAGGGYSQ